MADPEAGQPPLFSFLAQQAAGAAAWTLPALAVLLYLPVENLLLRVGLALSLALVAGWAVLALWRRVPACNARRPPLGGQRAWRAAVAGAIAVGLPMWALMGTLDALLEGRPVSDIFNPAIAIWLGLGAAFGLLSRRAERRQAARAAG